MKHNVRFNWIIFILCYDTLDHNLHILYRDLCFYFVLRLLPLDHRHQMWKKMFFCYLLYVLYNRISHPRWHHPQPLGPVPNVPVKNKKNKNTDERRDLNNFYVIKTAVSHDTKLFQVVSIQHYFTISSWQCPYAGEAISTIIQNHLLTRKLILRTLVMGRPKMLRENKLSKINQKIPFIKNKFTNRDIWYGYRIFLWNNVKSRKHFLEQSPSTPILNPR